MYKEHRPQPEQMTGERVPFGVRVQRRWERSALHAVVKCNQLQVSRQAIGGAGAPCALFVFCCSCGGVVCVLHMAVAGQWQIARDTAVKWAGLFCSVVRAHE